MKKYVENKFIEYRTKLEKSDIDNLAKEYKDFINNLDSLLETISDIIKEYREKAYTLLSETFYEKTSDRPLNEIISLASNIGVLPDITKYLSREKILRELDKLNHKQLYELFNIVEEDYLKDQVFETLLTKVHEISCEEMLDYEGYFTKLYSYPLYREKEIKYALKLLKAYVDLIPIKCDSKVMSSFLYNIDKVIRIKAYDVELFNKLREAIVDFYLKHDLSEIAKFIEYKPYKELLESLDKKQLDKLLNGLLDKLLKDPSKIRYARLLLLNRRIYLFNVSKSTIEKLCGKAKKLWDIIISKLDSINDFVEYVELYVDLRESLLEYWLEEYCNIKTIEPDLALSHLRTLIRKSIELGRSYDDLRYAVDQLGIVDKELSKTLRKTIKYYKRKYGLK